MTANLDDREGFAAFLLRLRGKGIVNKELIAAFEATPRRDFIPERWHGVAWAEGALWVGRFRGCGIVKIDPETGEVLKRLESDRPVTGGTWPGPEPGYTEFSMVQSQAIMMYLARLCTCSSSLSGFSGGLTWKKQAGLCGQTGSTASTGTTPRTLT